MHARAQAILNEAGLMPAVVTCAEGPEHSEAAHFAAVRVLVGLCQASPGAAQALAVQGT